MGPRPMLLIVALVAVGALIFHIVSAYSNDITRAKERVSRGAQVAATAVGPIEYADNGAGPALLSIHGAGGGYDQGSCQCRRFR